MLDDHRERHEILTVPHVGEQEDRFKQAMRERNARIKLYGQPEILHACEKCVRFYPKEEKCSLSMLLCVLLLIDVLQPFLLSSWMESPLDILGVLQAIARPRYQLREIATA